MNAIEGVFAVLVSKGLHDVYDVLCAVIFHGAFEMAECFEGYLR